MSNLLIGYLLFLNEENRFRRENFVRDSIDSLSLLSSQNCDLVVFDNVSILIAPFEEPVVVLIVDSV